MWWLRVAHAASLVGVGISLTIVGLGRYTSGEDGLTRDMESDMNATTSRLIGILCVLALGGPTTYGQVIQLPTFDYFSVRTSVMVPDSGGAFLGGLGRSAQRSRSYGFGRGPLLSNRVIESSGGASLASVHATIIDHEELDRAVRAAAAGGAAPSAEELRAAAATHRIQSGTDDAVGGEGLVSVAEAKRRSAARKASLRAEAEAMFADGKAAEARGELSTARIFYQMAHKRADGELQQAIRARLAALPNNKKSPPKPARHTVK